MDRALASLSLACALCARETRALEQDFLARRYLAALRLDLAEEVEAQAS
jgi:hypothetical protein